MYSDEVWTGIEYQVASHLISFGLVDEGLTIVKAARGRYDGRTRNPWNEYECGSYYARAMSSYSLLLALSGFWYSAVDKTLFLAPKLDAESYEFFFSTATGWGILALEEHTFEIRISEGELAVACVRLTRAGQELEIHPGATARVNQPLTVEIPPSK